MSKEKISFVYVTYIRSTPEKVFEAITKPEIARRYWGHENVSDWKPGSTWRLLAPDGRVADDGRVLEIEPQRRLVLSWQHQLTADVRDEGHSRMTLTLEPEGESVKLTILHEIDKADSKLIEGVASGWPAIIASLKSLLETGKELEVSRHWPEGI